MPELWAKALRPTTALLGCTGTPETSATRRLNPAVCSSRSPVPAIPFMASTTATSSTAALPARSPMPFTVASNCRAPARTAARQFAVDRPMSSWQWADTMMSGPAKDTMSAMSAPYSSGRAQPTVSGMFTRSAPASMAVWTHWRRKTRSARVASSALNCTAMPWRAARRTDSSTARTAPARGMRSLRDRWMSDTPKNTWMTGRPAPSSAAAAASTSPGRHRARAATSQSRTAAATRATAAASSGEDAGKPASIVAAPKASSLRASSTFSSAAKCTPGVCSPSRRVVSNMRTFLDMI